MSGRHYFGRTPCRPSQHFLLTKTLLKRFGHHHTEEILYLAILSTLSLSSLLKAFRSGGVYKLDLGTIEFDDNLVLFLPSYHRFRITNLTSRLLDNDNKLLVLSPQIFVRACPAFSNVCPTVTFVIPSWSGMSGIWMFKDPSANTLSFYKSLPELLL